MTNIIWFKDCSYKNKDLVGGKCSSLGELYSISKHIGFSIGDGFAITINMYNEFIEYNNLEMKIQDILNSVNIENIKDLEDKSKIIRNLITNSILTSRQIENIDENYKKLSKIYGYENIDVAVRSSALAEDLPNASFAGQHDTFLNIKEIDNLINAIILCFASLFNTRAISYRKTHNIPFHDVKISVAIQKMIRSDVGSAGVAFSLDPETGYDKAIVINSSFGLGELVVSGGVKPDEFILDKRVLYDIEGDPIIIKKKGDKNTKIVYDNYNGVKEVDTTEYQRLNYSMSNNQIITLGRYLLRLEKIYSKLLDKKIGVDVEWAIDGVDNNIYIIQTRPETIHSNDNNLHIKNYSLVEKGEILLTGVSVGDKISSGSIKILDSINDAHLFEKGDIIVTDMTTPDWEPLMKISSGIITNKGGRTCHAAIVARELGVTSIVGTVNGTELLEDGMELTVSCAEGDVGYVYKGLLEFKTIKTNIDDLPKIKTKLMML